MELRSVSVEWTFSPLVVVGDYTGVKLRGNKHGAGAPCYG